MTSNTAITPTGGGMDAGIAETVLIGGDLSKLTPAQRLSYYRSVCASLGLNEATRPFEYITLNGKLTLYARKDAADQLRKINIVSISKPEIQFQDDWIIVSVVATDVHGRTDSDLGVVNRKDMRGDFGNALMKAVTKAKRRVTLSICGLGMLDETEVDTIPDARPVQVEMATGEIVDAEPAQPTPKSNGGRTWTKAQISALVDSGLADDGFAARGRLDKSNLPADASAAVIKGWGRHYAEARGKGMSSDEAAAIANNYYSDWLAKQQAPAPAAEETPIWDEQPVFGTGK